MKPGARNRTALWQISLACLLYAIIVPRLKDYSYVLLTAPAFYLVMRQLPGNPLLAFCGLLLIFTYRGFHGPGLTAGPLGLVEYDYHPLITAWFLWGMCCYSILREQRTVSLGRHCLPKRHRAFRKTAGACSRERNDGVYLGRAAVAARPLKHAREKAGSGNLPQSQMLEPADAAPGR